MNKVELVSAIVENLNGEVNGRKITKKDTAVIVDEVFGVIGGVLVNEGEVKIANFGKFSIDIIPSRMGRNPQTGEPKMIDAYKRPKFKVSSVLKNAVKSK